VKLAVEPAPSAGESDTQFPTVDQSPVASTSQVPSAANGDELAKRQNVNKIVVEVFSF